MISYPARNLPTHAQSGLDTYQRKLDAIPDYAKRVEVGKSRFADCNRENNKTFGAVRRTLDAMCSGACRCMYCEDSCAYQIDHFRPKAFYPEAVFVWENYCRTCGFCNGPERRPVRGLFSCDKAAC